jgi:DNA-binding IclR family transcriptional regulator
MRVRSVAATLRASMTGVAVGRDRMRSRPAPVGPRGARGRPRPAGHPLAGPAYHPAVAAPGGTPEPRGQRGSGAETARKVLGLLDHFDVDRPSATVRELAEAAGLPLPTAHRYVALLRELGMLEERGRSSYQLGWRVLDLARVAETTAGLLQVAMPVLRELVEAADETAVLLRLAGAEMECVGQVESEHVMRLSFRPGQRLSLTRGASARVLLGGLAPRERSALLDRIAARDAAFRERRERFEREVQDAQRRGWAESFEEIDPGMWAVAAPVHDDGRVVASLAVAGPTSRLADDAHGRIEQLVTGAAARLSAALSARAPA